MKLQNKNLSKDHQSILVQWHRANLAQDHRTVNTWTLLLKRKAFNVQTAEMNGKPQ